MTDRQTLTQTSAVLPESSAKSEDNLQAGEGARTGKLES